MSSFSESFENMTIAQLRELTEQFEKLQQENTFLKTKYPTRAQELEQKGDSIQDLLKEVGVECL